jgi:hypothetical protein
LRALIGHMVARYCSRKGLWVVEGRVNIWCASAGQLPLAAGGRSCWRRVPVSLSSSGYWHARGSAVLRMRVHCTGLLRAANSAGLLCRPPIQDVALLHSCCRTGQKQPSTACGSRASGMIWCAVLPCAVSCTRRVCAGGTLPQPSCDATGEYLHLCAACVRPVPTLG